MSMATAPYLFTTPSAATYPPPFPIFPPPPPPPPGFPYAAPLSYPPPPPGFFPAPPFDNRLAPTTPPPPASYSTPTAPAYGPAAHLFCANSPEVVQPHHHIHEHFPPPPVHLPVQGLQQPSATHADLSTFVPPPPPPPVYSYPPPTSVCTVDAGTASFGVPILSQPPHAWNSPIPSTPSMATSTAVFTSADDYLNHRFVMEDDASVQAVADERVPAKDGIYHQLQREVLNLQARLDQQQASDRISIDTIRGELAKLTSMASQLVVSIGKFSTSATSGSSAVGATDTAFVAPKVFVDMPTPNSWNGTHVIAPECENYGYGHPDQIQSSCVQGGRTNLSEQYGLRHHYGFGNLNRQTVFLAEGTEHSYYTLPADYSLKLATPPLSSSAVQIVSVRAPLSVAAQAVGLAPVCCSKTHNTAGSETMPESYLLEQATSEPLFSNDPVDVSASTLEQQPDEEEQHADVQDCTIKLQQKNDESTCSCPVIKASNSSAKSSSKLSIVHGMSELRMLWDPGASTFLYSSKAKPPRELSYVDVSFPKGLNLCNQVGTYVQHLRDLSWNLLVTHERQKEWDPGDTTLQVMYKPKWWLLFIQEKISRHNNIKFYGIALWMINFQPP